MMKISVAGKLGKGDLNLVPGKNFVTGIDAFSRYFGKATNIEQDLLTLASAIYATDLAVKRERAEDYIRDIDLTIEVMNKRAFEEVKDEIERVLFILSSDNWTINFVSKKVEPEPLIKFNSRVGLVLLFSGGLDSLCAASELVKNNENISLISHITHNKVIENCQSSLQKEIEVFYKKKIERFSFRIFARSLKSFFFPEMLDREDSQRTRSFLFLTLGALVARRKGFARVVMIAENGQFAIHLPLTSSRVGPFSTHTAHPEFIHTMEILLSRLLALPDLNINNPYLYKTKSEVVATLEKPLRRIIPFSVSCWRSSRLKTQYHCGECVPCLVRRIALEAKGIFFTEYEKDLFKDGIDLLSPDDIGKRNFTDLVEFIKRFSDSADDNFILESFPELFNQYFDQKEVILMYKRFSAEALGVLNNYPKLRALLR